jgi:hypothetical protein
MDIQPGPARFFAIFCLAFSAIFCLRISAASAQSQPQRLSQLDAAFLLGVSGDGYFLELDHGLEASFAHGARWQHFSLLGGLGYTRFDRSGQIPLYAEASSILGKKGRSQFQLRAGYAFAHRLGRAELPEYRLGGGWLVAPAYNLALFENTAGKLSASLGYRYQRSLLVFQPFSGGAFVRSPQHFHFIFIKIAWTLFHQKLQATPYQ